MSSFLWGNWGMIPLHDAAVRICAAGRITPNEVGNLRPLIWSRPELTDHELRELVMISEALDTPCPEFTDFFAEAVTHFLLRQTQPNYYLQDQMLDWVERRLAPEGVIDARPKLEAMVRVLEQAVNAPERYKQWVLDAIERAVLTGQGPTRDKDNFSPGVVDRDDATYLRRVLFARGGKGATHVTADEAEMLFRIKDIVREALNSADFETLFVQCCGNFVLAHAGKTMLDAAAAIRLERVMDDHRPHIARFLLRIGEMDDLSKALGWMLRGEGSEHDRAVADAARISAEETAWLKARIVIDGRTDRYEKALLTFLADEAGDLPPVLEQLRRAG